MKKALKAATLCFAIFFFNRDENQKYFSENLFYGHTFS